MQPIDYDIRHNILNADGNIVISASAGTGKTRITVDRITKDIEKIKNHQTYAAITFTRKAAKEIKTRLNIKKGDGYVGTNDNFVLTEIIQPFMYDVYGYEFKKELKPDYSSARSFSTFQEGIVIIEETGFICKYKNNKINFSFQLALEILKKSRAACMYLKSKYYRIFIDEYQDSDIDMHNLFMYICKSLNIPLFIVGDTKQSIYGWRGGYLKGFKDLLVDKSFKPFTLIHNFRSNVQIQNYSNIFMDDVRSNYQECTITDEIIAFLYKEDRYAVDYIKEWIDDELNCAFLIRANANAQTWSDNLQKSGIDFMFLPSSPLDNTDLESEHVWVARLLAFYFLQEKFSEYDFIDEMPSAESYDFKTIKKKLQAIRKEYSVTEQFRSNCISLYEYVGYEVSDKMQNEITQLYTVINDPKYIPTYNPSKYKRVVTTVHSAKGLQYKQVIILGSDYNFFIEDDKYLHYVAVSRPEDRLLVLLQKSASNYINNIKEAVEKTKSLGFTIEAKSILTAKKSQDWST